MANPNTQKNRRPQSNQSNQRRSRTPSLDEAIKLVKQHRGKENLYGMLSTNDRGDVTEVGVYNGNTKRYALYRSDLVDADTLTEFKTILGK